MSTSPHANSSASGGDSSWLYSGVSGSESSHGGGSDCDASDSGTSDAGCDSGGSDGGGGGDGAAAVAATERPPAVTRRSLPYSTRNQSGSCGPFESKQATDNTDLSVVVYPATPIRAIGWMFRSGESS